jgi:hypothetical protein
VGELVGGRRTGLINVASKRGGLLQEWALDEQAVIV